MLNKACSHFDRTSFPSNCQVSISSSGLFGFGLCAILLNLFQTKLFSIDIAILAMGVFYGGVTQIMVGLMEWNKNNIFGATAFISFGLFWLSLVGFIFLPEAGLGVVPQSTVLCAYFFLWGAFTLILLVNAKQISSSVRIVFITLVVYFIVFSVGEATGSIMVRLAAGYCGFATGGAALYAGMSLMFKQTIGCPVNQEEQSR